MTERGRHRRHQPNRLSRASLTVTAGGAGVALPLLAATGTAAAEESWSKQEECATPGSVSCAGGGAPQARPQGELADRKASEHRTEAEERGSVTSTVRPASYRVVSGDTLSGIAEDRDVAGGWQDLYADNRRTIGRDPDLILPGQRLVLGVKAHRRGGSDRRRVDEQEPAAASSSAETKPRTAPAKPPPRHGDPAPKARRAPEKNARTAPDRPAPAGRSERRDRESDSGRQADRDRSADLVAPVAGFAPSTPYRSSGGSWSSGHHTGVDFPVATGTAVKSMARGRVVTAGWGGAYGYQVVIRHPDGRYSQYGHLSAVSVRAGQEVNAGQRIGRSGSTGNSTGPHLHFEVRTGPAYGSDIDPLAYLRLHGVDI